MKRLAVVLATTGLVATSLGVSALAQPAFADGGLAVTIDSAGTKKVVVSWADGSEVANGPFDAYLVTLDNDSGTTPDVADRSRFVDKAASPLEARFEDLNANTTYYAAVYAVDFSDTGYQVVPASGQSPNTPLGIDSGSYSPLTIASSTATVLSGRTVTLSGILRDADGKEIENATVTVLRDVYPQFGGSAESTTTTNASGQWSLVSPPLTENTWFWAEYRAEGDVGGWTGRILVEVRKQISVTVDPGLTVKAGTNVKFSGSVNGNPEFLDDSAVSVCLQRLRAGTWSKLFCRPIEANGGYLLSFKPGRAADGKYRVWSGMGLAYADSWSATRKLVVN